MYKLLLALILLISSVTGNQEAEDRQLLILHPPSSGMYHCAFPDFGNYEDEVETQKILDFEELVGKDIVWAAFSNNWLKEIKFPKKHVQSVLDAGCIPYIRMMAWSNADWDDEPDEKYRMQSIIDGDYDKELVRWFQDAKTTETLLMVVFGVEVNGSWFPWNGKWNGGGSKEGYGDKNISDGPERFVDAYRHIVNISNEQGADNINWVFHINNDSIPEVIWNKMRNYYPGDDYVDWIGVSVYGAQEPDDDWILFSDLMDDVYTEVSNISKNKPLALLEFGVVDGHKAEDKAEWIKDALDSLSSNRYPRIKAIGWWHESWENDDGSISNLRIDSSPSSLKMYQRLIQNSVFIETID